MFHTSCSHAKRVRKRMGTMTKKQSSGKRKSESPQTGTPELKREESK